jgi:hypothetical protein
MEDFPLSQLSKLSKEFVKLWLKGSIEELKNNVIDIEELAIRLKGIMSNYSEFTSIVNELDISSEQKEELILRLL